MHDTAYQHGRLFFELYGPGTFHTVVELGSQDVNGSLRDHCPPDVYYIGLDMTSGKGVDVIVDPAAPLPIAPDIADAIVTSSAFEHDVCFWDTFLELTRILRPGGLLYVNAPANGDFHRYPLDCWRFYPDAGVALVQWAARRDIHIELVESFVGLPQAERWADFVAVFRKAGGKPLAAKGRIADHVPAINIHCPDLTPGRPPEAPLLAESSSMPDAKIAASLQAELAAAQQRNLTLSADLAAARQNGQVLSAKLADVAAELEATSTSLAATSSALDNERDRNKILSADLAATRERAAELRGHLGIAEDRVADLEPALAHARQDLLAMQNSTSWRVTAGLRRLVILLRGR